MKSSVIHTIYFFFFFFFLLSFESCVVGTLLEPVCALLIIGVLTDHLVNEHFYING